MIWIKKEKKKRKYKNLPLTTLKKQLSEAIEDLGEVSLDAWLDMREISDRYVYEMARVIHRAQSAFFSSRNYSSIHKESRPLN